MGFLELGAAFAFFRTAEVVRSSGASIFTYDMVLCAYVVISILCGLYLLGVYRLPHDTPNEHLGVPRLLFSMAFLGLGLYLMPALFKTTGGESQRPSGVVFAWFDAFLLPDHPKGLEWEGNLNRAVAEARQQGRETGKRQLIFLDFTGKTCKNCKYNEGNIFTRADVRDLLAKYRRVQLYTDSVPEDLYAAAERATLNANPERPEDDAAANLWFQDKAFDGNIQLPLYVILEPQGDKVKVLGIYDEGKINDVTAFNDFLRRPLQETSDAQATANAAPVP
jgi:thiol:disulfide interchange protein DsbD